MENNNSKHTFACMICGILTFCGVVVSIISIVKGSNGIMMPVDVASLVVSALLAYYAFSGYKKPHGNLLKYIIVFFTIILFIAVYLHAQMGRPWMAVLRAITIGLSFYIAGRLHKVKQNKILMSIITVLILIGIIIGFVKGSATIGAFTHLIIWIDICVAYFMRYKEHKEAGLMDAEKK